MTFKLLVAGSRSINQYKEVERALLQKGIDSEWDGKVITGDARGVDACTAEYARRQDLDYEIFEAGWEEHGDKAELKRNVKMVQQADKLIAIWDGHSNGTRHTIEKALEHGLDVEVVNNKGLV